MKTFRVVDLFCGAGGMSTGIVEAARATGNRVKLTAIDQWPLAIESHAANHPKAEHWQRDLTALEPLDIVPAKNIDLLTASPPCTHHSNARGGGALDDASRSMAWRLLRWVEDLQPATMLVENVPEFVNWGPLGDNGRPVHSLKGEYFRDWVRAISRLGYTVEHRVLNAADYGDATTRRRVFVQACRGRRPAWPAPTHAEHVGGELLGMGGMVRMLPWRPAREIIDWDLKGKSIYHRKRPLSAQTMKRIEAGLREFGGDVSFVVQTNHADQANGRQPEHGAHRLGRPLPTLTQKASLALCEPSLINILLRMLQPHELAAAMSFPAWYRFAGSKADQVKQIGNAVAVGVARALMCEFFKRQG